MSKALKKDPTMTCPMCEKEMDRFQAGSNGWINRIYWHCDCGYEQEEWPVNVAMIAIERKLEHELNIGADLLAQAMEICSSCVIKPMCSLSVSTCDFARTIVRGKLEEWALRDKLEEWECKVIVKNRLPDRDGRPCEAMDRECPCRPCYQPHDIRGINSQGKVESRIRCITRDNHGCPDDRQAVHTYARTGYVCKGCGVRKAKED